MHVNVIPLSKNFRRQMVLNPLFLTSDCDRFLYVVICSRHAIVSDCITYTATCSHRLTSGKHVMFTANFVDFSPVWDISLQEHVIILLVTFHGIKCSYTLLHSFSDCNDGAETPRVQIEKTQKH